MTTQTELTKTTGNFNAVFTTILGMLLIAAAIFDGATGGTLGGFFAFIGVVAIVLGIYFQGKPKAKR